MTSWCPSASYWALNALSKLIIVHDALVDIAAHYI